MNKMAIGKDFSCNSSTLEIEGGEVLIREG